MPQLFVLSGPDVGKSFEIKHNDTLGRSPDCIVTLRDSSISRRHAHIERMGAAWFIVDDGSRNGITVDGARTKRAELRDMQEFSLGELLMRFRVASPEPSSTSGRAAPAPSAAPAVAGSPPPAHTDDELVLEDADEFELDFKDDSAPRAAIPPPPPPPPRVPQPEVAATSFTSRAAAPELAGTMLDTGFGRRGVVAGDTVSRRKSGAGDRVLQFHKIENTRGAAGTDLAQLPWWLRWGAYLLVFAIAAALAWFAFFGTASLKSKLGGGDQADAVDESE